MSRMGIIVNVDECIGCHACFIACKQENQVSRIFNGIGSVRLKIEKKHH